MMNAFIVIILAIGVVSISSIPDKRFKRSENEEPLQIFHNAAQTGNVKIIEEMLKNGTNVDIRDHNYRTPLFIAAQNGHLSLVQLLVMNGANVNHKTGNKQTALWAASFEGHLKVVELLIKNGSDVNIRDKDGWTPLHAAVEKGHEKIVDILLKYGSNPNWKNKNDDTSIDLATKKGNAKIIELLKTVRRPAESACKVYSELPTIRTTGDNVKLPWLATIGSVDEKNNLTVAFNCLGTIISEFFIVTTASCVSEFPNLNLTFVRLVKVNPAKSNDFVDHQIKDIFRYPKFSSETKKNDIALIQLEKAIKFVPSIVPACLHTDINDMDSATKLFYSHGLSLSSKVEVVTMSRPSCSQTLLDMNLILDYPLFRGGIIQGQYCAHHPVYNYCFDQARSGPLQYFTDSNIPKIVGIVVFDTGCYAGTPVVFTRIAYYLHWIEAIVWPDQF